MAGVPVLPLACGVKKILKPRDGIEANSFAPLLASDNSGMGWDVIKIELWGSVRNV